MVRRDGAAMLAPPWARDAQAREVPTHYEIDGTTVVQVVNHRSGVYDYAITADPFWWAIPVAMALHRCWANPYCNWLVYQGRFWTAIDWARRHLF
jgi:hypothetical protein